MVAYAILTVGWLLMSLLVFGVDETVDPARFALLPVRARELLPGLLAAALVGVPGVATVLMGLGLVVTWARSPLLTAAALVAMPLGVVSCVLLARVAAAALAAVLSSRRFWTWRWSASSCSAWSSLWPATCSAPGRQRPGAAAGRSGRGGPGARLVALRLGLGGARRCRPRRLARRRDPPGARRRAGRRAVVGLGVRPRTPAHLARRAARRQSSGQGVRLGGPDLPETPAGGIAARTLRYWRRDPRYLAGVAGFLVGPVILIVLQLINPMGNGLVAVFAPTLVGLLVGLSLAQDLAFDGSALWLHVGLGLRGADDRAGCAWSALVIFLPMILVLLLVSLAITGAGAWAPQRLLSPWARPWPGWAWGRWSARSGSGPPRRPARTRSPAAIQGGLPALLSATVTTFATLLVSLPTLALAVWSIFTPWVGALALVVGIGSGLAVLRDRYRLGWPAARASLAGGAAGGYRRRSAEPQRWRGRQMQRTGHDRCTWPPLIALPEECGNHQDPEPLADAARSTAYPCSVSQRWRVSAPRFLATTSRATPAGVSRTSQVSSSSCRAALPIRIGGLDQISS